MGNLLLFATPRVGVQFFLVQVSLICCSLFQPTFCLQNSSGKLAHTPTPQSLRLRRRAQHTTFKNKWSNFTFFSSNGRPSISWLIQLLGKHWRSMQGVYTIISTSTSTSLGECGRGGQEGKKHLPFFSTRKERGKALPSKSIISFSKGLRPLMMWWSQEYLIYLWETLHVLLNLKSGSIFNCCARLLTVNLISSHFPLHSPSGFKEDSGNCIFQNSLSVQHRFDSVSHRHSQEVRETEERDNHCSLERDAGRCVGLGRWQTDWFSSTSDILLLLLVL